MKELAEELQKPFQAFSKRFIDEVPAVYAALDQKQALYQASYYRLTSLQAWRSYIIEPSTDKAVASFFLEAQNDGLLSHCFARLGSWRASLKSLRGLIDNLLFFLYYKDHPVEYQLWVAGKHSLPISEFITYLANHPLFHKLPEADTGLDFLRKEYSTLSKAVHGSSEKFRMTDAGQYPAIMVADFSKLGKWVTREKETIRIVNMLLVTMYRGHIDGAKLLQLRKSVSFAIPKAYHARIRTNYNVRLLEQ